MILANLDSAKSSVKSPIYSIVLPSFFQLTSIAHPPIDRPSSKKVNQTLIRSPFPKTNTADLTGFTTNGSAITEKAIANSENTPARLANGSKLGKNSIAFTVYECNRLAKADGIGEKGDLEGCTAAE